MEALILIDIQRDYFPGGKFPLLGMKKAASRAARLLAEFRREGKPVIHVRHESLRPGSTFFLPGTPGAEIHDSVMPAEGEPILVKNYPNSFRGTGLAERLSGLGVDTIHVAGAMTNMCVDTTVRAAFDLGFRVFLHPKACAARGLLGTPIPHLVTVKTLGSVFAELR